MNKTVQNKILTYITLFFVLFVGYLLLRDSTWQGTKQLHTLMEIVASTLAFLVGTIALVRFYSKKDNTFLFIGTGFLGTGLLDVYHTVVTSTFFDLYFPSPPPSLIPWSWIASRLFLAILLWLSWLAWHREQQFGKAVAISQYTVYLISGLLTMGCFFFFAFVPLPRAYYPELFFHRPEELVPAIFFLLALIGYLKKGHWREDNFEHWLILSLIVGFMGQVMFMSFSGHLFDTMFDSAHLLKKVSYICVLIGLLVNMYAVYLSSEKSIQQLSQLNASFKTIIDDVVQVSQGLAIGNLTVTPQADYGENFVPLKRALETTLSNQSQVIEDIIQVSQGLAVGNLQIMPKATYQGDFIQIKNALETTLANQNQVIKDITQVSQGLAIGDLQIMPTAEYRGDFVQIKNALETTLSYLGKVIRDVVQVSQGLAEGNNVTTQVEYQGDFAKIKNALEIAVAQLADATIKNKVQDWLKSGQSLLNEQLTGEQEISRMTKKIISFLTTYVEAQIGLFYLLKDENGQQYLQIVASYAYINNDHSPTKVLLSEGLAGQAALERKIILRTQTPEECPAILSSGLTRSLPQYVILLPFLYEGAVKGVIEIGSTTAMTDAQRSFLEQVMPNIGIAVNTAESRTQMQILLEQSQCQTEELQSKQAELQQTNEELQNQSEELQTQQEELRQTNEVLEERTSELERQREIIVEKNLVLEKKQTEMEQAKMAIETKAEELELASKYKSEFLANMSHELRTPLNSLLILAQLLAENKSENLEEKQVEYARTIHSAGEDLLTLINEILDLAKVEAGKIEIHLEELTLADFVESLEHEFRHVAENKRLDFQISVAENLPASLQTDAQRLKQIIHNLLSNAFKFTHEGKIKLSMQYPDNREELSLLELEATKTIAFSVTDTGIGIPKDQQPVIFEAFQQADGSTSRSYGGTGLGLSISRQLARLLGGEIKLASEKDQGSTFTLYLPIGESKPSEKPLISKSLASQKEQAMSFQKTVQVPSEITENHDTVTETSGKTEKVVDDRNNLQPSDKSILIIEDDRNFSKILVELAQEKGFKYLIAKDGETGLQLVQEYQPHAIILDVGLPQLDGLSVMERLKDNSETRHIPVHFISASDQSIEAKKMGAIGYLIKPVSMSEVGEAFKKIERFVSQTLKHILVMIDNETRQRQILELVESEGVKTTLVAQREVAYQRLQTEPFDCIIIDVDCEQGASLEILEQLQQESQLAPIPVIIYAERDLKEAEEKRLQRCETHLTIKAVKSPERLLDEATLFVHQLEAKLPSEKRRMLEIVHDKEAILRDKTVLIVDDDMRNAFALMSVLEGKSMNVLVAENGKEALEILDKKQGIHIVLMDIMMPEMDGYKAIQEIRAQPRFRQLPIIALTAKAMKGDKSKCIEAGANDYLAKPMDTDKLFSLMRVWLYR